MVHITVWGDWMCSLRILYSILSNLVRRWIWRPLQVNGLGQGRAAGRHGPAQKRAATERSARGLRNVVP